MKILEVKSLDKFYGKFHVLKDINLEIGEGELVGLVGPNGSGKSTLMRTILNLEPFKSGTIKIMEQYDNKSAKIFDYITFLPSENHLYGHLSGHDHMMFISNMYRLNPGRVDEIIEKVNISHYVKKRVNSYSYGMRQRMLVALSLLINPKLILMDEPFNGLDPTSVIEMKELILSLQKEGISLIISTHNLDVLQNITNHIWFIREGTLYDFTSEVNEVYEITVDQDVSDIQYGDHVMVQGNSLKVNSKEEMNQLLPILISKDVNIVDISIVSTSLEETYKEIYNLN